MRLLSVSSRTVKPILRRLARPVTTGYSPLQRSQNRSPHSSIHDDCSVIAAVQAAKNPSERLSVRSMMRARASVDGSNRSLLWAACIPLALLG